MYVKLKPFIMDIDISHLYDPKDVENIYSMHLKNYEIIYLIYVTWYL